MRSLLLVCGVVAVCSAQFFNFPHKFSKTVKPCDDFYQYACNFDGNRNDSFTAELRDRFYADILELMQNYDLEQKDPIFNFLRNIVKERVINEDLFSEGEKLAQKAFEGDDYPHIFEDYQYGPQLNITADAGEGRLWSASCKYNECPPFIKGIAHRYRQLADRKSVIDPATWTVKALYRNPELARTDFSVFTNNPTFHLQVLQNDKLAPYINVVVTKLMIENGKFLSKEKRAILTEFYQMILEEVIESIQATQRLRADQKTKLALKAKEFKFDLYFADDIDNVQIYNDALKFYQTEILKNLNKASYVFGFCEADCLLDHLGKLVHKTFRHYLNSKQSNGSFLRRLNGEKSIYNYNPVLTGSQHMAFYPGVASYLQNKLPFGIQFGAIGFSLARELFRHLGISIDSESTKSVFYDHARCYTDYFQSYGSEANESTILYNDLRLKRVEGFADVEGMRVALRALSKSSPMQIKSRVSMSALNDVEWFFSTVMLASCDERSDSEQFEAFANSPQLRNSVRLNAIVRQMPEFSRAFFCKPEDKMFHVDKICSLYGN